MDFNSTIDLIIKELRDASEIIDDLKKYPDVPVLQVELAKLKCKNAGEVIALLKTMKPVVPATAVATPPKPEPVIIPEPSKEEKPAAKIEISTPPPKPRKETQMHEVKEHTPVIPAPEKKKEKKTEAEQPSIADRFSKSEASFYDQLGAEKTEEELADLLQAKPIQSLADAIGLNDKFLFIREIFKGNHNDYNQAIVRLETADSLADARAVIMSYTGENNESEAIGQLLELVRRKLPANE